MSGSANICYKIHLDFLTSPWMAILLNLVKYMVVTKVAVEESVWSVLRLENEREYQGEGVQNSGKTST